jgi:hypothetical protein
MTTIVAILIAARPVAAEAVDLALVLAADVSRSVDQEEFQLQRRGYAAAIQNQRVLNAILSGTHKAIALCFIEWSGARERRVVVDWTVIRDAEIAAEFAGKLLAVPRSFNGSTAIGAAIDFAVRRHAESGIESDRRAIDVSGDGDSNQGRPITGARDDAVAAGITVNGLAIINERDSSPHTHPAGGLVEYYRQNVIGGPGAFVLEVNDFAAFGEALADKLVTEIVAASRVPQCTASAHGRTPKLSDASPLLQSIPQWRRSALVASTRF